MLPKDTKLWHWPIYILVIEVREHKSSFTPSFNIIAIVIVIVDELDSFMYQTVGHMGIEILAKAMALPLYRHETKGQSRQRGKQYTPTEDDEVEDLFSLLTLCKVSKIHKPRERERANTYCLLNIEYHC